MRLSSLALIACLVLTIPAAFASGQDRKATDKSDGAAEETHRILVESVGLLGGLQLYNSYLNIGILADAMADEVYSAAAAGQLLDSVIRPLERVEKQFDRIATLKLTREDAEALARMKKIASLLREQGKQLELVWSDGQPQNGKKYESARQAAWKELTALLELDKAETLPPPRETPGKKE